jgi:hypothetical protein
LTKRKRTAESFAGQKSSVTIYPVILKRDAKVIERTDFEDASDVDDIVVELYEKGIDAVWIGGGEEELTVVNPYSIILYKDGSEYFQAYGGFKSTPLTDEQIKDLYENSKVIWEKYSELYNKAESKDEKNEVLSSIPKFKFDDGGTVENQNLSKESLEVIDNNYNAVFGFYDFEWNKESERENYSEWLEKFYNQQFTKNLDTAISKIKSDIELLTKRKIAKLKLEAFEELIIPALGNEVLMPKLSVYEKLVLMNPSATIESIEKGFKEAKNIIDEDGSLNQLKITQSNIFEDDYINLPNFERFVKSNPEYKNVFNDWKKLFDEDIELSLKNKPKLIKKVSLNNYGPKFLKKYFNKNIILKKLEGYLKEVFQEIKLIRNVKDIPFNKNFCLSGLNLAFLGYYVKKKIKLTKNIYLWPDGFFYKRFFSNKKIIKIPGRKVVEMLKIPINIKNIYVIGNLDYVSKKYLQKRFKIKITHIPLPMDDVRNLYEKHCQVKFLATDLIFLTLPTPKQEEFAYLIMKNNNFYKIICIGGAINIASGLESPVPDLLDKMYLEFVWRLRTDTLRRIRRLIISSLFYLKGELLFKYRNINKNTLHEK